jgi:hypothetical protein
MGPTGQRPRADPVRMRALTDGAHESAAQRGGRERMGAGRLLGRVHRSGLSSTSAAHTTWVPWSGPMASRRAEKDTGQWQLAREPWHDGAVSLSVSTDRCSTEKGGRGRE